MARTIQPIGDRLLRYRDVSPDGCWLWTGSKNNAGYGHMGIRVDGRRKIIPVHRVAYEHFVGPIPEGLQIDHLCRVRACFNPEHLEPVSSRINTLRGTSGAAVNAAKTHCDRGHEFTPENTYLHPAGWRRCRACQRRPKAAYGSKKASAA